MAPVLRVSEAAAMALHTMAFLAVDARAVLSTHELASRLSGSEAHLAKVLQRLNKAGLVTSSRGPQGGFSLAQPASQVNLLQVWEAIDGAVGGVNCMQNSPVCDGTTCVFGALVARVNQQVRDYLGKTYLNELSYSQGRLVRLAPKTRRQRK